MEATRAAPDSLGQRLRVVELRASSSRGAAGGCSLARRRPRRGGGWCRRQARGLPAYLLGVAVARRRGRRWVTPGWCGKQRIRSPLGRIQPSSHRSGVAAVRQRLVAASRRSCGNKRRGLKVSGGGVGKRRRRRLRRLKRGAAAASACCPAV